MFIGPYVIQKLREFQIGQFIREDGPQSHQKKSGTPTMGGVLIVIAILLPTVLWSDPANPFVWIAVCSTLAFGAIGFADDYTKVVNRRNLGLTARAKLFWQGARRGRRCRCPHCAHPVQALLHAAQRSLHQDPGVPICCGITGPARCRISACWPSCPSSAFIIFVLMGTSNAVNLTDGLDGLAIGCTIIAAGALTVLTYVSGHVVFADYLELQRMPLVAELTVFCGSMVGASIGFLWYNAHPAEVFMGDVGSLALGGAIGTVAVIIRQEFLLPFIGGIFVLEARLRRAPGRQLQAPQKAHLQDGPAAPPLRAVGLERVQGHCPLLDRRPGLCPVCPDHSQTALAARSIRRSQPSQRPRRDKVSLD